MEPDVHRNSKKQPRGSVIDRLAADRPARRIALMLGSMLLVLILIGIFLYARVNVLLNRYMEAQGEKQAETLAEVAYHQFHVELTALSVLAEGLFTDELPEGISFRAAQDGDFNGWTGAQLPGGAALFGKTYRADEFPCLERAERGESAISYHAGSGLMFCVPAIRNGKTAFVVYRLYPEESLFAHFGVNSYSGIGRTRIVDDSGQVVVTSVPEGSAERLIFDEPPIAQGLAQLEERLSTTGSAALFRRSSEGEMMLYAAALQESGFHLIGYVPKSLVMEGMQQISFLVIAVFVILTGTVFAFGCLLLDLQRKSRESEALREAARIAEKSNAAKSEFLSNMSHDIRTPMNAIIGFTNLAIQDPKDTERVTEYLGKIQASSSHLLSLINDVLEMSRIESGKIELDERPCSLPKILHDLNTIIIGQVEAKQQELMMDAMNVINEDVYCDKLRLNQVLLNLLSNAVKYTPAGGKIGVRVIQSAGSRPGYAAYELRVKDNGIGMTPDFAERVFEAFEREKTSTVSGIQGTGLGMAITKQIVDLMGGTIRVETEKDKGSEFIVNVELRVVSDGVKDYRIPELTGIHALVVDDDFHTCDSVTNLLTQMGMRPEWTLSGKEAVLRAKHARERGDDFGAYLIDWKLPDLNGVEATRQIRAVAGPGIPILLMTAYDWPAIRDEAVEAGVNGFCNKPLFFSELQGALTRVVGSTAEPSAPRSESTPAPMPKMSFAGKRLLLVDDIEMNREIATLVLQMNDFEVELACDGTEAVEKVLSSEPGYYDAVLMDIQMPSMNGYEATRRIRGAGSPNSGLPIVAMTANAFDEDIRAAHDAGMDGHLAKPIDPEKLVEVLGKLLLSS